MNIPSLYELFQEKWGRFQSGWMISDTHFGDKDLRAGMDRPSDEEIVKSINSKVGKCDLLIHMGDVGDVEYVRKLKGYKVLIMGNHDAGASNYKRHREMVVINAYDFTQEEAVEEMKRRYPGYSIKFECMDRAGWIFSIDNKLFDEVYEGALIVGEKLMLSHEPVEIPWLFNIHGHNHQGNVKTGNHLNVCADVVGYEPVSLNKFLKEGHLSKIQTIHRACIDNAIERKKKRGGKKIGQK